MRRINGVAAGAFGVVLAAVAGSAARADDAVVAVVRPSPGVLNLRIGNVDTAQFVDALGQAAFDPAARYVLVLDGPMSPDREAALAGAGVALRGYLPTNAFVADLSNATPIGVRALGFVVRAVEYVPEWTVAGELYRGANARAWRSEGRQQLAGRGKIAARLWLFDHEPAEPALAALALMPEIDVSSAQPVGDSFVIEATLPAEEAGALTAVPGLLFAEPVGEYDQRSNIETRWVVQANSSANQPLYAHGLTGTGQVIGVIDGQVDVNHCSFSDTNPIGPTHRKILAYNIPFSFADRHGTHVAGTALGDAGVDNKNTRGVAYNAKMVFSDYPDFRSESSGFARYTLAYSQGATVHSNSWGDDLARDYDGLCRAIDTVQHDSDDNLILFAVSDTAPLVANPENAKNSLAVSASGSPPTQDSFCIGAPGPTLDGRRKPEVMAPGCGIFSSQWLTACGTIGLTGTSMATPAVAGLAALTRQYFTTGLYPTGAAVATDAFTPSGALLKAVLVNSAVDLTGVAGFPSVQEGWGRVQADNALYFAGDARRLILRDVRNAAANALTTGQTSTATFDVLDGQSLKVTLAYHDAPASVAAAFTPVNDLNLVVIAPDGAAYLGNDFAGGVSTTGGPPDAVNNLEQVLVAAPTAGRWSVRVIANAVNLGPQGYALIVTGGVSNPSFCLADFDGSGGTPDTGDIDAYFNAWLAGDPRADSDGSGGTPDANDIVLFFDAWLAGC